MAEVFKARMRGEEGFEKIVAIKRIVPHMAANEAFITMFVDEAKLAAQLNHNNITHIYDLGKVEAWHYIAMEFVEGKDLRTLLKLGKERSYPLPPELALFIAAKIANALDYAHRRPAADGTELNLVHRDVSPQNILISYEGDIKLCDFGIAKAASKVSTTISGALKGKLQYMSPEQAWGKRVDRRSDIFSLGAVLHEMLTGAPLFEGDTDMSILERVREGEVEPPSRRGVEVSRRVDQIVLKALAKNPQERYQNASEMEKDLHAVLYAFQPSPGPADVAIYLHRLLEAPESSPTGDEIDAAFDAARDAAPPPAAAPVLSEEGQGPPDPADGGDAASRPRRPRRSRARPRRFRAARRPAPPPRRPRRSPRRASRSGAGRASTPGSASRRRRSSPSPCSSRRTGGRRRKPPRPRPPRRRAAPRPPRRRPRRPRPCPRPSPRGSSTREPSRRRRAASPPNGRRPPGKPRASRRPRESPAPRPDPPS